ncbi:S41 family peptidase [Legionella longbeachae]|uniref:Carboxy-terminal protease n=1 Tax=Legionella longbeachae serogroup 1 (strain NSW150) TaxID=661367 RepID=D3HL05_LEGLN|nr:S41 family peptidase [Legionella longbeachae]VEE03632.1 carboxy-terminal protease [Legionella oakridgensis]HBD7397562.1 S41 family peptidase [Legionella pneumophila]ARB93483.1 S41 family peptidase [Legionella longbeachae]ARM33412.1 S41 family peptidase [Legionella longbeachae]EEZ93744.1 C-terminal processing peptidase family protein [Legionella longbeachae D-4968]
MLLRKLHSCSLAIAYAMTLMLSLPVFADDELNTDTSSNASNSDSKAVPLEDVQRFSNAIGEIKKYYVKPIDDKELFDNAIRGMLSGLDPHSSFLDEEEFKELQTSTSGEFGGLGLEVTMEDGVVKVVTPLVDTPAFKAGIKSGDYIIKIGKESVQGLSLKDAVNIMRGKAGSTIELTVLRKGVNKALTFDMVREVIQIKSVQSKLLAPGYGYIRLTQFQALTGKDMLQAIAQLKQKSGGNLKGLILDLRNNPGGLLDSAIQVSDAFLGKDKSGKPETIVSTKGRLPGSDFTALSKGMDVLHNAPMVVLINNGSASAAEIVAGALKDNKRAVILGTTSFGKGSVQTVLPLDNKTGIKLTTALYYTPSGTSIQATGIIPDIVVNEVEIPKNAAKPADATGFSEADLNGHILNKSVKNTKAKSPKAVLDDLMHSDYQLYAALTVLEGMSLANR